MSKWAASLLAAALGITFEFFYPALCWCARTIVESIIAYSLSASDAKYLNIFAHTPVFAQRVHRLCVFFQSPNRSGKSLQGIPARYLYNTASTNNRLSFAVHPN